VAETYLNAFDGKNAIQVVPKRPGVLGPNQYFAIRIRGHNGDGLRDRVYAKLRSNGIYARRYFYPLLSDVPVIRARLRQDNLKFPRATAAAREVLVLPLHGGVQVEDAAMIARLVIEEANG
jgi:dTDP-4-amino-4,6-dideoxygalactose transaminase